MIQMQSVNLVQWLFLRLALDLLHTTVMSKQSAERRNALPATSTAQVLHAVGNEHLDLVSGKGYWYFIYDDAAKGRFDTYSVYTMRLSNLTVNQWAVEGREFVARVESK